MNRNDTAVLETIRDAVGNAAAKSVFGEPVSREGITVVPAAKVSGGGGGGGGEAAPTGPEQQAKGAGTGGGFGLSARPAGAFVITDGRVGWHPALDVNKVIIGGQIVAIVAMLTARAIMRIRLQQREAELAIARQHLLPRRVLELPRRLLGR